jgi:hypothetical protein
MATLLTDIIAPSSVVTINGTQTLTNKTLVTPTIATINAPAASSLTLASQSGYDVLITAGGNTTAFKQSGSIEPYGAISGSSYGSNYLDVTQLGPLMLGGELYGVTIRTSADRVTYYNYEFGTNGVLTTPKLSSGDATLTGTLTANSSVGTSGQVLQSTGTGVQWATISGGTSISQGNSSITVSDSGTGTITTTVDGTSVQTSTVSGTALLGIPTAPTAAVNTSTTQIATTAFAVTEALNKAVAMAIALG